MIIRRFNPMKKLISKKKHLISFKEDKLKNIFGYKLDLLFCTEKKTNFISEIEDIIEIGEKKKAKGQLIICPTPIGNIKDISIRQYESLLNADIIACEDTRVTGKLFKMFKDKRIKEKFYENFDINVAEIKITSLSDDFDNNKNNNEVDDTETKFFDYLDIDPISKTREKKLKDLDTLDFMRKYENNDSEYVQQESDLYGIHDEFILYLQKKIKELKEKKGRGLLISYYKHNEDERISKLIKAMKYGLKVILVSDAGTPALCDPGYKLVNSSYKENVPVISLPGSTAIAVSLSASGFPTDRFIFEGYLSKTPSIKVEKLEQIKNKKIACALFESNNRILKTLLSIEKIFGEDQIISVGMELTKLHENIMRGRVRDIYEKLSESDQIKDIKGEITLVISPYTAEYNKALDEINRKKEIAEEEEEDIANDEKSYQIKGEHLAEILDEKLDTSDQALASLMSNILNISKNKSMKMVYKQKHKEKPLTKFFDKMFK